MSYRVQSPLDFSDTDSESETYWKRLSTCAQKGDTDCQESIERRRCNIWVKTANENILDEALSSAHIVTRSSDTSRHVENYFEYPASQETPSNTSESKQLRRRVGSAKSRIQERHWNESIPRNHIGVTFDSPPDVVKKTLVRLLKEPNEELISQIVDVLGCKRALEFYFLTEDIEKIGGLYCADGTRRRSPGGVFLNLIKMSQGITDTEKKTMFALSRRIKDKLKRLLIGAYETATSAARQLHYQIRQRDH
ncbi:unnamed protein product [Dicrocoelium dendriticum]|nr:unnamed protein product [Dicrocoelium dendriticum]